MLSNFAQPQRPDGRSGRTRSAVGKRVVQNGFPVLRRHCVRRTRRPSLSGLPADEAFHEHVLLRDAIASGNERVAESVAYAHIERDRKPTFEAMRGLLAD